MAYRSRFLVSLLALALVVPAVPAMAQSDSRSLGDVIADGMSDAAAAIGSMQDEISDMAAGIDPSDPDGEIDPSDPDGDVDPGSPTDGDDVDPGDIDPSDPDADPGDPIEPDGTEPDGDDGSDGSDGGIELPEPSEPEEGGFREILLAPDPAPRAGTWRVKNKQGTVTCTKVGTLPIKATPQTARIFVGDDGKKLSSNKFFKDQKGAVNMKWDPETDQYRGKVKLGAPGGKVNMNFTLRVVSPGKMVGSIRAKFTVNQGGISGRCTVRRGLELNRRGN